MKYRSLVAVPALVLGTASAFAADHSTAINAAFTDANTNVGTVITGIVALAAVVTGATLIYRWLTK